MRRKQLKPSVLSYNSAMAACNKSCLVPAVQELPGGEDRSYQECRYARVTSRCIDQLAVSSEKGGECHGELMVEISQCISRNVYIARNVVTRLPEDIHRCIMHVYVCSRNERFVPILFMICLPSTSRPPENV